MTAKTRVTLYFRSYTGQPALPFEARVTAKRLKIELGDKVGTNTWDCGLTPDQLDKLADAGELVDPTGSVRLPL